MQRSISFRRSGRVTRGAAPGILLLAGMVGLLAVGCADGGPDVDAAQTATVESEGAAELRAVMDRLGAEALEDPGAVGLSVAIARGDDLVEAGYGSVELEHGIDADAHHLFRIGSITKQFTAAGIMKLVEAGEIDLDAPFTEYLADYPAPPSTITVRHLLLHSSGIPSYTGLGELWTRTIPLEFDHAGMLEFFAERPLEYEPGSAYRYNNSGYYLLGMIIEALSGQSYADFVAEDLVGPIGLARIQYDHNAAIIEDRAEGYGFNDGVVTNDELIGMTQPGAAGALMATAGDLVRWMQALSAGRVVSPESFAEMTRGQIDTDGGGTYGFGLAMREVEGHRGIGHGGGINGFNSMLTWYPDDDLIVATISNSGGYSAARLADGIARDLLGLPPAPPPEED